jgi:hypothetical protein
VAYDLLARSQILGKEEVTPRCMKSGIYPALLIRCEVNEGEKMLVIFWIISLLIALTMGLFLSRAVAGPGVFNRVAAVNVIGIKTIGLLLAMR